MKNDPIVIVSVARTPMGSFNGELKKMSGSELGSAAIRAAVERSGVEPEMVQEAVMGCVLPLIFLVPFGHGIIVLQWCAETVWYGKVHLKQKM